MRTVRVIGIGAGGVDQLTGEAVAALKACAYVIAAEKKADDPLLAVRARLCEEYGVPLVAAPDPERDRDDPQDYGDAVRDWHAARVDAYADVIALKGGDVGFLVWGDPSLYDSTLRIADALRDRFELDIQVVPGIPAPSLLAAAHGIVLHEVGKPVLVTTGRRLLEDSRVCDNLVVMLDGRLTCADLEGDWSIWWGANLGTATEARAKGPLHEAIPTIRRLREEAREQAGWVMDTYLVRRTHTSLSPGVRAGLTPSARGRDDA